MPNCGCDPPLLQVQGRGAPERSMRTTPKLRFHYDTLQSEGMNVEQKIKEARSKDQMNISNDEE